MGGGHSKKFHIFSAIFWLSIPVLTYIYPLFTGYGYRLASEIFAIINAGLSTWVLRIVLGPMPAWASIAPTLILGLAIAFMPLLIWLCVRGIGLKSWIFLLLWYASGTFMFIVLSSK